MSIAALPDVKLIRGIELLGSRVAPAVSIASAFLEKYSDRSLQRRNRSGTQVRLQIVSAKLLTLTIRSASLLVIEC
jgi:hypothetical protein